MSLIGIWGHSAIGKTTWLHSIKDELKEINRNIIPVFADGTPQEYWPFRNGWFTVNKDHWKGIKDIKVPQVPRLIASHKIWILESMRWFIGMQPDLTAGFKANGNSGLHMIIVYSKPEVQREWRKQRCELLGKPWNDYWDKPGNLRVENNRGVNSIRKHFQPAGVPCASFEIGYDRKEWAEVTAYLKGLL